jgi:hypothetical protein
MWIAANQPRPAADGPQLDTNPAVTPDYTDDGSAPGSLPGSPAAQLPGGEEPRPGDPARQRRHGHPHRRSQPRRTAATTVATSPAVGRRRVTHMACGTASRAYR